ncbi:MAG TPA: hypothetical protein VF230_09605 [Acidimicrobiales bacterium]
MPSRQPDEVLGDIVRRSRRQRRRRVAVGASPVLAVALVLGALALPSGSSLSLDTAPASDGDADSSGRSVDAIDASGEDAGGSVDARRSSGSAGGTGQRVGTRSGAGTNGTGSGTAASPLAALPGSEGPAPQPDLTLPALTSDPVVFLTDRDGRGAVWTMDADGARPRLVVEDAGIKGIAVSPDGSQVAFASSPNASDRDSVLYVVPRAGGEPRLVHSSPDYGILSPDWSPDGSTFLFVAVPKTPGVSALNNSVNAGPRVEVRAVGVDGTGDRFVANDGTSPRWSADGTRIVFLRSGEGIFTANADGTDQRNIGAGGSPAWSPDGRIVFLSNSNVAVMDADGTNQQVLTAAPQGTGFYSPSWSTDGKAIVAWKQSPSGCAVGTNQTCDVPRVIVIMRPDGSGHRTISSSASEWLPRFPAFRKQAR